mgnify:CR=1 FL=1
MPGANVAIKELGIGSITNAEGYFSIKGLEAATYTLDITYIGYKKISKSFAGINHKTHRIVQEICEPTRS